MYYIPYTIWDTVYYRDWLKIAKTIITQIRITKEWVRYDTDFIWDIRLWIGLLYEDIAPSKSMLKNMYKKHKEILLEKWLNNLD